MVISDFCEKCFNKKNPGALHLDFFIVLKLMTMRKSI